MTTLQLIRSATVSDVRVRRPPREWKLSVSWNHVPANESKCKELQRNGSMMEYRERMIVVAKLGDGDTPQIQYDNDAA